MTKFNEHIEIGLNTNSVGDVSETVEIKENSQVAMQVIANSGAHTTHIVDLQCSADGAAGDTTWHNVTNGSVNQTNIADGLLVIARYVRARVSTAENAASTVDVYLQSI